MSLIQVLDAHCANQIAAGEVVERPVSVVKELVENALDAQATVIDIFIEGSGVSLIRVRDNGSGIAPDDLPVAILRHATSKIRKIDDLNHLTTLGFRGEALPSIASVSKLEICSRVSAQDSGFQIKVQGGTTVSFSETGCPVGTTVSVEDLFYNTPARRKFLKSDNTEFGLISDMIGRIAIARPDVAFMLKRGDRTILQTPGNNNLLEAISCVYGSGVARQLIPMTFEGEEIRLRGYISPPNLTRSSRQSQVFIVNGRVIRSQSLSLSLEQGYHTLIPARTHPIAILCIETDPSHYDVNVHPSKMEIRFKDERSVMDLLSQQVQSSLLQKSSFKPFALKQPGKSESFPLAKTNDPPIRQIRPQSKAIDYLTLIKQTLDEFPPPNLKETEISPANSIENDFAQPNLMEKDHLGPAPEGDGCFQPSLDETKTEVAQLTSISAGSHDESHDKSQDDSHDKSHSESLVESPVEEQLSFETVADPAEQSPSDFLLSLTPVGQVFNSYILATSGETLVIIDQHAAHERINYEQIYAEFKASPKASQQLLVPITFEFTPIEEQLVLEHIWELQELGFLLEHFGDRTYLLRGVPTLIASHEAEKSLRDFLATVQTKNRSPRFEELVEDWIYLLACRESLKANEKLSSLEMSQLIGQLAKTKNPFTCPHGRPILTHLSRSDFEKQFLRK